MNTLHYGLYDQWAPSPARKHFEWTDLWTTIDWACPNMLVRVKLDAVGAPPRVVRKVGMADPVALDPEDKVLSFGRESIRAKQFWLRRQGTVARGDLGKG